MQLPVTIVVRRTHWLARCLCRGDIVALLLGADGRLGIQRQNGSHESADVDVQTTVFPALVILRFRVNNQVRSLALPRAATGAEAHRKLRVWLRWCVQTSGASAGA